MMVDALTAAMHVASSGIEAQSLRLRVVSENMANANSTSEVSGGDPYRRKTISFEAVVDRASGAALVSATRTGVDDSAFPLDFDPGNLGANAEGYVKRPNVSMLVEMADMREANRSYEANLQTFKQARELISMTIDLMRTSG